MEIRDAAIFIAETLSEKKAQDITIIDVSSKTSFADYMVLASGTSKRQVDSLCEEVEEKMEKNKMFTRSVEGKRNSDWVLMDYGDIIVNLLTLEMREKYNIEKVWGDCEFINLED
ncbi:MAG: ribosome silencing factor [Anaerovoracaceae bacterium]